MGPTASERPQSSGNEWDRLWDVTRIEEGAGSVGFSAGQEPS